MFIAKLNPLNPAQPGFALLTIENWKGSTESVVLTIQSNQEREYLKDDQTWVGYAFEHQLRLDNIGHDNQVQVILDKTFVDPLVSDLSMSYRLTLSDPEGVKDVGTLSIATGVLGSQAAGQSESLPSGSVLQTSAPEPEPEPTIEPEPVEPEIVEEATFDTSEPMPSKEKKGRLWIVLVALLLLILVLAFVLWTFLFSSDVAKTDAPVEPELPVIAGACSSELLRSENALTFVQGCLKTNPNNQTLLQVISEAKQQKICDVARRLYVYKAQSGDANIAFQYAQEFDPKTAQPNSCFVEDPETAIYWYQIVLNNEPQNSEARERLQALQNEE